MDAFSSQPLEHNDSVMRAFLESGDIFKWPENLGKCSGIHCDISRDVGKIPLKWNKVISDKANASIDMYEAGPDFNFPKTFVVKTIRGTDTQKAIETTANEVENMRDLRHPHVTALLGTFTHQARLSILIFPAACCDLHQFMKRMSRDFEENRIASHSDGTSTVDSDTTNPRHLRDSKVGSASKHKEGYPREVHGGPWPLTIRTDNKIELLRRYFVCLSRALRYLHKSGVRHKDIKPENILVDESGSVLLTDFGIARRFSKHTPHATNNEWKFTRKYASPEIMKDRNAFRDDSSDIFSLGCVFLEMATLLLGKTLNDLSDYYTTIVNDSSKEKAYHCNLEKVHAWIDQLRSLHGFEAVQEHWVPGVIKKAQSFDPSRDNHMTAALVAIRQMLDENPSNRPVSKGLWQRFQHISGIRCRDCDPRRKNENWKPSATQHREAQTGISNRRSLHAVKERSLINKEPSVTGDVDSTMLSTQLNSDRSLRRSQRRTSPSTKPQDYSRHGHIRTISEPGSPGLQLDADIREDKAQAARSPSPKLRAAQKEARVREETRPKVAPGSSQNPSVDVIDETTDYERQTPDNGERPSVQLPPPNTPVIVYDVSQTIAFETVFASLKGALIAPSRRLLL